MSLPILTIPMIREFNPCVDPTRYAPEDWAGTIVDVLKMESVERRDAFWLADQPGVLPEPVLRLIATTWMRQAPHRDGGTIWDHLSESAKSVVEVVERRANGAATNDEIEATCDEIDAAWQIEFPSSLCTIHYAARKTLRPATYPYLHSVAINLALVGEKDLISAYATLRQIAIQVIEETL